MATTSDSTHCWLADVVSAVEARLSAILSTLDAPSPLKEAMGEAVLSGGKRLRPAIVCAVAERMDDKTLAAACAVELIHCYSLVHDDLPCMDDAACRRGRASCHRVYGEAVALLVGDCLQSLAFESASAVSAECCQVLAQSSGAAGMGGGQALDILAPADDEAALLKMVRLKTGALFACAVRLGLFCRATPPTAAVANGLLVYAEELGLLFQLANDIQGLQADTAANKKTYATTHPQQIHQRAMTARDNATAALSGQFPHLAGVAMAVYSQ